MSRLANPALKLASSATPSVTHEKYSTHEMMLRHMGWREAADLIIKGMEKAIEAKTVTYDLERLMSGATCLSSSDFGKALIKHM